MTTVKHIFLFILVFGIIISGNLIFYKKINAFVGVGGVTVQQITPTCTNGRYLMINGKAFLLPFSARLYAYGVIIPYVKIWSLGTYIPGGVCIQPYPLPSLPVAGTIKIMGTSLPTGF